VGYQTFRRQYSSELLQFSKLVAGQPPDKPPPRQNPPRNRNIQWLKWKIRGEGTVYQLWAKMGPQQVVRDSIYEIWVVGTLDVNNWRCRNAGTAFPCVQWHFNHWEYNAFAQNLAGNFSKTDTNHVLLTVSDPQCGVLTLNDPCTTEKKEGCDLGSFVRGGESVGQLQNLQCICQDYCLLF